MRRREFIGLVGPSERDFGQASGPSRDFIAGLGAAAWPLAAGPFRNTKLMCLVAPQSNLLALHRPVRLRSYNLVVRSSGGANAAAS
jgi:hypothetical protein